MSSLSFTARLLLMLFGAAFATAALTPGNAKAEYEPEWEQLIGGYGVAEVAGIKPFGVAIAELFGFTRASPPSMAAAGKTNASQAASASRTAFGSAMRPRPNPARTPAGQPLAGQGGDGGKAGASSAAALAKVEPAAGGKPAASRAPQSAGRAPPARPGRKSALEKDGVTMFPGARDYLMRTFEGRWTASDCGTRYWQAIRTGIRDFRVLQWQAGRGIFREDRVTLRTDTQNLELHWVPGSEKAVRTASAGKPAALQAGRDGEKRVEILGIFDRTHYDVAGRGKSRPFRFYRAHRCGG